MNRLKQKLKSESGASILLALLFFLICALVAAAVLMAAVSNAGKIKSNQEMHQKYLAVSSALELVCDDLLSAEYRGQYTVTVTKTETPTTDDEGTAGDPVVTYNYLYKQENGEYNCKLSKILLEELDQIFAAQMAFDVAGFKANASDNETHAATVFSHNPADTPHTLTISPAETDGVEMPKVQVSVTLDKSSYAIKLTARLVDDAAYGMEAELTPNESVIPRLKEETGIEPGPKTYQTDPMTWKLGWITKASQK